MSTTAPDPALVHPALRPLLVADGVSPIADIPAARSLRRRLARERGGPAQPVARVTEIDEPRLRLYEPLVRTGDGLLVVLHGGGWVWGGLDEVDPLARSLASQTGRLTVTVGYRLAPEHRFPAALDDVGAAVDWLVDAELDFDRRDIVVLGLSAGGNLAAGLSARRRGSSFPVAAQVLVYPMLDPSGRSESARSFATVAPLSRARELWFWDQYAPAGLREDPDAAPVRRTDLTGMPPSCLVLAEVDVLRDEGLAYAERLAAAGVPVRTQVCSGMVHGFLTMAGLVPQDCAQAVVDIADWIARLRSGTATP